MTGKLLKRSGKKAVKEFDDLVKEAVTKEREYFTKSFARR